MSVNKHVTLDWRHLVNSPAAPMSLSISLALYCFSLWLLASGGSIFLKFVVLFQGLAIELMSGKLILGFWVLKEHNIKMTDILKCFQNLGFLPVQVGCALINATATASQMGKGLPDRGRRTKYQKISWPEILSWKYC